MRTAKMRLEAEIEKNRAHLVRRARSHNRYPYFLTLDARQLLADGTTAGAYAGENRRRKENRGWCTNEGQQPDDRDSDRQCSATRLHGRGRLVYGFHVAKPFSHKCLGGTKTDDDGRCGSSKTN